MKLFTGLAFLVTFLFSCTKSSDLSALNPVDILVSGPWQTSAIFVKDSSGAAERDIFPDLPAYQQDNYFTFSADSTYELNDNIILRNDTAVRIIDAGRWYIEAQEGQSLLQMVSNTFSTVYHPAIIRLQSSSDIELERIYPSDNSRIRTRLRKMQ